MQGPEMLITNAVTPREGRGRPQLLAVEGGRSWTGLCANPIAGRKLGDKIFMGRVKNVLSLVQSKAPNESKLRESEAGLRLAED
jgi:hypothetical protein